jgi:four helix bundle protein
MPGVKSHEELASWQLCEQLKEQIFAFTDRAAARGDFKFCNQIRTAATSATDNLAEGFYRYYSRDFARFCSMTRGSLGEIKCQLLHARKRGYLSESEFEDAARLTRRAMAATTKLQTYLRMCPPR